MANTNSARLFVFDLGRRVTLHEVNGLRVSHTRGGGWSQMSYQRHADNLHLLHAKEVEEFDGARAKAHGVPAQLISEGRDSHLIAADLIVPHARQTGARVTFVEDAALLTNVGGVGALLRYRF